MAIKYENALKTARNMLGTPYSEVDCIRLIVMIIRKSSGGNSSYRCEGTNWLWRSIKNTKKYRHIEWAQESIENAQGGMLAFKRDGEDIHHVGFVTHEGTVIHSSSVKGMVVETPLDSTWHLLARHRDLAINNNVIQAVPEPVQETERDNDVYTSLIRDDGITILVEGRWRVAED